MKILMSPDFGTKVFFGFSFPEFEGGIHRYRDHQIVVSLVV